MHIKQRLSILDSLDRYLQDNYTTIREMALTITRGHKIDSEELSHEVIISLYSGDREKLTGLIERKQMRYWILRIILNQYNSSSSPFHYQYRKPAERHRNATHDIKGWSEDDVEAQKIKEELHTFVEEELAGQAVAGDDCGCQGRKDKLNKIFPYYRTFNAEDLKMYEEKIMPIESEIGGTEQRLAIDLYQRVTGRRQTFSRCPSCVIKMLNELKTIHEHSCADEAKRD